MRIFIAIILIAVVSFHVYAVRRIHNNIKNFTPEHKEMMKKEAMTCIRLLSDKYYFNEVDINRPVGMGIR